MGTPLATRLAQALETWLCQKKSKELVTFGHPRILLIRIEHGLNVALRLNAHGTLPNTITTHEHHVDRLILLRETELLNIWLRRKGIHIRIDLSRLQIHLEHEIANRPRHIDPAVLIQRIVHS